MNKRVYYILKADSIASLSFYVVTESSKCKVAHERYRKIKMPEKLMRDYLLKELKMKFLHTERLIFFIVS